MPSGGRVGVADVGDGCAEEEVVGASELNDDFAQDVSEYKTFAEYRAAIVKELEERRDQQAEVGLENELVQKAVDAADCDIPEAMVALLTCTSVGAI